MESIAKAILSLKSSPTIWDQILDIITASGAIIAAVLALITIWKIYTEIRHQKQQFIEASNQKERENIIQKLNLFFGPLKTLRSESKTVYDHFAIKEKEEADQIRAQNHKAKRFRTLRHLSQGKTFSKPDLALLGQIIKIGKKQLRLIEKEGNIISNAQFADLLGKLGAHIRFMSLAAEHKLDNISERLEPVVFPREVDGALETEIRVLQDRLKALSTKKPKERVLKGLGAYQNSTISTYNNNAQSYFRETAYIDMAEIYEPFTKELSIGSIILDAGCGVGRDTRYFIGKGYRVVSFDASIGMVKFCRQYPFAYCLHKSFSEINYIEEFDAIWACASLHHLPPQEFSDALYRLYNATKPGGIIYFSLKIGTGTRYYNGIMTYYHEDKTVNNIVQELMLERIVVWETHGKKHSEPSDWKNFLYRKPAI